MHRLASLASLLLLACDTPHAGVDAPRADASVIRTCRSGAPWAPGSAAFVDRTEAWGLSGLNGNNLAIGDLDGDGFADLVVSDASTYDRRSGHVFFNRASGGGRTFVEETARSGLYRRRDAAEDGRHASMVRFADVDDDGDLDAYTGIFLYHTDAARTPLADSPDILLNDGTGTFTLAASPSFPGPARSTRTPRSSIRISTAGSISRSASGGRRPRSPRRSAISRSSTAARATARSPT